MRVSQVHDREQGTEGWRRNHSGNAVYSRAEGMHLSLVSLLLRTLAPGSQWQTDLLQVRMARLQPGVRERAATQRLRVSGKVARVVFCAFLN